MFHRCTLQESRGMSVSFSFCSSQNDDVLRSVFFRLLNQTSFPRTCVPSSFQQTFTSSRAWCNLGPLLTKHLRSTMAESDTENQYSDPEKTAQDTAMNVVHQLGNSPTPSKNPSIDAENVEKPAANPWMDPKSFPDGGAKAWFTVAGSSACLFVSFGWINCVGVFQAYYQTHQLKQYSPSDIAWIPSLQSKSSPFNRMPFADNDSLLHVVLRTICWQNFR